ncbi:MAG: Sua5/YciO/YrdC/YwlC family protein, partial [Deltaproteobacteria bacterium]|nr:Sua5/YciO/YrdC/YwlC family protein [Deltaproteobacteria bacterium]
RRLLPGPYTFILDASRLVPKILLPKRKAVGIRVPANTICLELVRELGHPIISTSVTVGDDEILSDPFDMEEEFRHSVDMVIDGGVIIPEESSVISFIGDYPEVIREGKGDVSLFI